MKPLLTLSLILTIFVAQNSYAAEHSNFGFPWTQDEKYIKWCTEQFGRYIDPNLSEFERDEYALLFHRIKYNFNSDLELKQLHKDPAEYIMNNWGATIAAAYNKYNEHSEAHHKHWSPHALGGKHAYFNVTVLNLAKQFAQGYQKLSPEEQKASASCPYGNENKTLRMFSDIDTASDTLKKTGISKTPAHILEDAKTISENFREDHCKEYATLNKYERDYQHKFAFPQKHDCLYAELLHEYVKNAQRIEAEIEEYKNKEAL